MFGQNALKYGASASSSPLMAKMPSLLDFDKVTSSPLVTVADRLRTHFVDAFLQL
jgi:hypothetical protein